MGRLLVLFSIIPPIFLVVKKQPFVLSFFTTREKRFECFFPDVENKKSFLMRLEKRIVPGALVEPYGENHRCRIGCVALHTIPPCEEMQNTERDAYAGQGGGTVRKRGIPVFLHALT